MRPRAAAFLLLLPVLSCGGASPSDSSTACVSATPTQLSAISDGLAGGGSLGRSSSVLISIAEDGEPIEVVAAQIATGPHAGTVGTWWIVGRDPLHVRSIMAVNAVAQVASSWGSAAQPGSQAYEAMQSVDGSPQQADAVGCLT